MGSDSAAAAGAMSRSSRALYGARRQRGVALITVLLVFAIVATLAAAMLERAHRNQRSLANLIGSRQAWHQALGGEAYARQLLALDWQKGPRGLDNFSESWALTDREQPFELDGGSMTVVITDLQGRLNINNVVSDTGQPQPIPLAQMARLVSNLRLDTTLAAQWRDWIDSDQEVANGGAEDANYGERRTHGSREADISALRLLQGMTADAFDRLAPYVSTLPESTPVNVNTASAEVLRSLSPILDNSAVSRIVARQQNGGFKTVEEFLALTGGDGATLRDQVALESSYFQVIVTSQVGDYWQRLRTVLQRNSSSGAVSVIARQRVSLSDSTYSEVDQER